MPVTSNICAVCSITAKQRCAGCFNVFYCSRDHQKQHWKIHKSLCRPIKICEDAVLGRYLAATRPIKAGDVVFKESPLVKGPAQITGPICLGCGKEITGPDDSVPCSKCGWPMCKDGDNCENSETHKAECTFTQKRGFKVSIQNFASPHPSYQCLTILRCLYLRDHEPEKWEKLIKLESHNKIRVNTEQYERDCVSAKFIQKFFKLEKEFTEDEILKVAGIVQVNGHEVPLTEPAHIAIYEACSMLEHDCRANCCKSFSSTGDVLVIAGQDIKADEHISICYVDPLWGTANRRHFLLETKYFKCNCARCNDPTEFGTMFNAIKCKEKDCEGYLLPKTFIEQKDTEDEPKWYCSKCFRSQDGASIHKLMDHIGKDLEAMEKGDVESCQKFLEHYGKYLHSNHYYMTDVRLALAQLIGQKTKNGLTEVPDELLDDKAKLCQKVNKLIKILAPAEFRIQGMLLFELHAAVAEIGRRRATKGQVGPETLEAMLLESKNILAEAIELLKHEPDIMPEGKIKLQARKNLADLEKLIRTLHQNVGDMP
ncbi:SET domain-containing protein SmydA-8-like [Chrysoperla carnea]|uniref:SET domain-containing protein SmydA-8-like n=1 Tax=Chrysoperla carnea TaxID=189513 RepID=UPI001D07356A|nr:SET domain-containing protein SmydA-8-like [Chrysoperla carnea]